MMKIKIVIIEWNKKRQEKEEFIILYDIIYLQLCIYDDVEYRFIYELLFFLSILTIE